MRVALYCLAVRSRCQGTASAYREAVVTITQTSAAQMSWAARVRFSTTRESMSGASRMASPRGRLETVSIRISRVAWVSAGPRSRARDLAVGGVSSSPCGTQTRMRSGSTRMPANQWWSSGWQTSTGVRVVGRSTPASLTCRPTRELTRVDLPAPVDPPTTASIGASGAFSRGTR